MRFAAALLLAVSLTAAAQGSRRAAPPYPVQGTCDGYPAVELKTAPGLCLGLVAWGLRFPRGVQPLPDGSLAVVEMGGWSERRGRVTHIRRDGARAVLIDGLDRPHAVVLGPDARLYVGFVGGILRLDVDRPTTTREDVIGGRSGVAALPSEGRHPLVNFVFDAKGDLYVGVGSATDNCELQGGAPPPEDEPCIETQGERARGVVHRYEMEWPAGRVKSWSVFAQGLRNSMALAVHAPTNTLLQGENSRDAIHMRDPALSDEDLPHDELNVLVQGAHYGWPYCYDAGRASPEYPRADCSRYRDPVVLLPAHAAPLGMTYYQHRALPADLHGALIVAFHGYRKQGHRVVAYRVGATGMPQEPAIELVSGWEKSARQPMGAPVDVKTGADGAVYITEDRNGTLLRLAPARRPN